MQGEKGGQGRPDGPTKPNVNVNRVFIPEGDTSANGDFLEEQNAAPKRKPN